MIDQSLTVAPICPPFVADYRPQERLPAPVLPATRLWAAVARVRDVDHRNGSRRRFHEGQWRFLRCWQQDVVTGDRRRRRLVGVDSAGCEDCLGVYHTIGRRTLSCCVNDHRRRNHLQAILIVTITNATTSSASTKSTSITLCVIYVSPPMQLRKITKRLPTPDYKISVCRCSQDTRAELHYMSSRLL